MFMNTPDNANGNPTSNRMAAYDCGENPEHHTSLPLFDC